MIRQAILVTTAAAAAVLAVGPNATAAGSASFLPGSTVECFRAPCPQFPTVVETTARLVFGQDGYRARGWQCYHVRGRVWECVQPSSQHRRPNA